MKLTYNEFEILVCIEKEKKENYLKEKYQRQLIFLWVQ